MPRDVEKLLEKELDKAMAALKEREDEQRDTDRTAFDARQRTEEAKKDVDALATAIAALRGGATDTVKRNVIRESAERARKEKPVA